MLITYSIFSRANGVGRDLDETRLRVPKLSSRKGFCLTNKQTVKSNQIKLTLERTPTCLLPQGFRFFMSPHDKAVAWGGGGGSRLAAAAAEATIMATGSSRAWRYDLFDLTGNP